jgi:tetraacyldisaccharide 4'-kinase
VPESFEGALRQLGASVDISQNYADHHRYSLKEVERFVRRCARRNLDSVLTTEKDAVRIPRIMNPEVPIYYLRVEIEILAGQGNWEKFVERLTRKSEPLAPQLAY